MKRRKYSPGDLVTVAPSRKFPVVLRERPGYTFQRIDPIDPGQLGLVLRSQIGHGMSTWIQILIGHRYTIGWIPENITKIMDNQALFLALEVLQDYLNSYLLAEEVRIS